MDTDRTDSAASAPIERYRSLCIEGLRRSYNASGSLWNRQLRDGGWADTIGTEDLTSTCICLIGLDRAGVDPASVGVDVPATLKAAVHRLVEHGYDGGLGLLVWANALHGDDLKGLLAATDRDLEDMAAFAVRLTSMEASWLLSGLLHEYRRRPEPRTRDRAVLLLQEVQNRYDRAGHGVMPHADQRAPVAHRVRRHVANFADQIYTVQALSFAALVLDSGPAYDRALALGRRMIELQGPLGQWWWHYDSRSGRVANPFPVYSVHQHAMAPMALEALAAAGAARSGDVAVAEPIARSHRWLDHNELDVSMVDPEAGTIWRDIEPDDPRWRQRLRHARALVGVPVRGGTQRRLPPLRLNRETRPYEWAWCLYAGAIAAGESRDSHIV